jgi:hypothetical protein
MPEEEHVCHSPHNKTSTAAASSSSTEPVTDPSSAPPAEVPEDDMKDALRFAPLALKAVYADTVVECQRIGWLQGWELVFSEFNAAPEKPVFALFATDIASKLANAAASKKASLSKLKEKEVSAGKDHGRGTSSKNSPPSTNNNYHSSSNNGISSSPEEKTRNEMLSERKEAVLVIRGTNSIHDLVTDIRAAPIEFPPRSSDEISLQDINGKKSLSMKEAWIMLSAGKSYACGGMVRAALWLLESVGPSLLELYRHNCDIIITGHSLGKSSLPHLAHKVYSDHHDACLCV